MKIKKRLLIAMIVVSIFAVGVNTALISMLTLRYFGAYLQTNYELHQTLIVDYLSETMTGGYSTQQMENELRTHLNDPIIGIAVYDTSGNLIASVQTDMNEHMNAYRGMNGMRRRMSEETDVFEVQSNGITVGSLIITRYGTARNSLVAWQFESALIRNGLISIGIVLGVTLVFGALLSRNMSRDLIRTAEFARTIDLGQEDIPFKLSKAKEIRVIQQSLLSLRSRLKIKQAARKALADELIHQSRTPLTILQSHLEAMQDGVIEMTSEEIKICNEQIHTLTEIISDIDGLIGHVRQDVQKTQAETFDFTKMIRQIAAGLQIQFDKKSIALQTQCTQEKLMLSTDRYLLSQALYNVLTNACKYTQAGGHVTLSCVKSGASAIVRIEDDGAGVAPDDISHLFEAYRRGSSSAGKGEGLGLYIAKSNLQAIGGDIFFEPNQPKGSIFVIHIPFV